MSETEQIFIHPDVKVGDPAPEAMALMSDRVRNFGMAGLVSVSVLTPSAALASENRPPPLVATEPLPSGVEEIVETASGRVLFVEEPNEDTPQNLAAFSSGAAREANIKLGQVLKSGQTPKRPETEQRLISFRSPNLAPTFGTTPTPAGPCTISNAKYVRLNSDSKFS